MLAHCLIVNEQQSGGDPGRGEVQIGRCIQGVFAGRGMGL